jgi:hypothetical protein
MASGDILQSLLTGAAQKNIRLLVARGTAPLPPKAMLAALVQLLSDEDKEIASSASKTISGWEEDAVIAELKSKDCTPSVLEHFSASSHSDAVLQTIIRNPNAPEEAIKLLASKAPAHLLEMILDNRTRLLESPEILKRVKSNPAATPEIQRIIQEVETEFFGAKKTEYSIEKTEENETQTLEQPWIELELPPDDLFLEGLPIDPDERQAALNVRVSSMSFKDKIRHASFGNREIRAILIRDSNRQVARSVLKSPKLTENEVGSFAAMRGVSDEILREIGNSKEFTKSYIVVQNLVRNPKTPPIISQRLLFRLRSPDLQLLVRDRSIPEAVRHNANRTLNQRTNSRAAK